MRSTDNLDLVTKHIMTSLSESPCLTELRLGAQMNHQHMFWLRNKKIIFKYATLHVPRNLRICPVCSVPLLLIYCKDQLVLIVSTAEQPTVI